MRIITFPRNISKGLVDDFVSLWEMPWHPVTNRHLTGRKVRYDEKDK